MPDGTLKIGAHEFRSRLFLGTGRYPSPEVMARCHAEAGTECVTVAVRRVDLRDRSPGALLSHIDRTRIRLLPNTAGCFTADEAVRTARLAREALDTELLKLEVIGDEETLYPDLGGLLEATRTLVREGFTVLPYTTDDLVTALRLEEAGAAAVMPLGSPIGSGRGIQNPSQIALLKARLKVPVLVDAGVGTASDVSLAMELGADGVLLNTAVACAKDPPSMARAMRLACEAGRLAWRSGRIPRREFATPSSPPEGRIGT